MKEIIKKFSQLNVLLIGDLILDKFIHGYTSRISREAPVLVLKYQGEEFVPGGGGNAAANLLSLQAKVSLISVLGKDSSGEKILSYFERKGADLSSVILDGKRVTSSKTRIMAGGYHTTRQQVIRIDKENEEPLSKKVESQLMEKISEKVAQNDLILLSDYGLGVFTEKVIDLLGKLAFKYPKKVFLVDSRYQLIKFKNMTVATPNEEEAAFASGCDIEKLNMKKVGHTILEKTGNKNLIITRGSEGMAIFTPFKEEYYLPIYGSSRITDVTGAGDTVSATVGLSLAAGADIKTAAQLATLAASIVVHLPGTVPVSYQELERLVDKVEKDGFYN